MLAGSRKLILLMLTGVVLYAVARHAGHADYGLEIDRHTGPSPAIIQQVIAGPCPGLGADANLLSVYSIYDQILHAGLDGKNEAIAWHHLKTYLERAQSLDPWFWDIYRLSGGLLGFHEGSERDAISIMEKGAQWRTWDWETPFVAGFLAYDRMHDDGLAYRLMRLSADRPGVPPMVIGLAAKFLMQEKGVETSLMFLHYMLKTMPEGYKGPIQERIDKLMKEGKG